MGLYRWRIQLTHPMKETFPDNSYIETDADGLRTVCGSMAHDEYFKRLKKEREDKMRKDKNENLE